MFKKVLIANRGEIALRVIRACRELDIKTGVIYAREDSNSLAVRNSDEGYFIDAPSNKNPYLEMDKIIDIALNKGFDAIHPGYGFLSENAHFAKKCSNAGIVFIGPGPEVLELTGDKDKTKKIAKKNGIPIIEEFSPNNLTKEDYPILLKATLGGGGKGIRILESQKDFSKLYSIVQREAERSFGKGQVLIEKYIPKARHIEIQILADKFGNIVHLYERECSIQRKMQKIIEEAPCIYLPYKIKQRLYSYAKKLAKSLKYRNVGTFEFLVGDNFDIYFLEVNPRIQVEHTVTEEITGVDIVKEQIYIAAGKKLSFSQRDVRKDGHAIELRINAEDVEKNFAPSVGKITELILPAGKQVRICDDIYTGKQVYSSYDSLLLKIVVKASDRKLAIKRARQSLDELVIRGVKTIRPLLQVVIANKNFEDGNLSTEFLSMNNSLKAARKRIREQKDHYSINFKELELEKNALIAATIFDNLDQKLNTNRSSNAWVLKSRLQN